MKITNIQATWLRVPIPEAKQSVSDFGRNDSFNTTLVRVETDAGLVGYGEAKASVGSIGAQRALVAVIEGELAPLLIGEDRVLAILFSDIRGFTTITELMRADQMIASLNNYFSLMVDKIMDRDGIVDKYMGDAIMAFFGAPVQHTDDALQAVLAGLDMQEALEEFNSKQREIGKPEFRMGIGINYGMVTVGNIGSEKKMDYTVIGDMVNLAARLETLTKIYKQELIISESVYREISKALPCRLVDKVQVLGKTQPQRIFTVKKQLNEEENRAWQHHHRGLKLYFRREFAEAARHFRQANSLLPGDVVSAMYFDRCKSYMKSPPQPGWKGVHILTEK